MSSFIDKSILITGGARGIGLACAARFARAGARVLIGDLLDAEGEAAAAALRKEGLVVHYRHADAADRDQVHALAAEAVQRHGGIDVAVCAAGVTGPNADFCDLADADFDRVLAINLRGPFLLGKAVAKHMKDSGRRGSIVHVTSVAGVLGLPTQTAYCASKAGLGMMTKSMSVALAPFSIRVNAVAPGPIATEMTAPLQDNSDAVRMVLSRTPLGRFGTAEEMAATVAFLASEDAGFITGQTIYADGGRLALNYVMAPLPAPAK